MEQSTFSQIEKEFDKEFNVYIGWDDGNMPNEDKIKSFLKAKINQVIDETIESLEKKIFIKSRDDKRFNSGMDYTIKEAIQELKEYKKKWNK